MKRLEKVQHIEIAQHCTHGPSVTSTDGPLYISIIYPWRDKPKNLFICYTSYPRRPFFNPLCTIDALI